MRQKQDEMSLAALAVLSRPDYGTITGRFCHHCGHWRGVAGTWWRGPRRCWSRRPWRTALAAVDFISESPCVGTSAFGVLWEQSNQVLTRTQTLVNCCSEAGRTWDAQARPGVTKNTVLLPIVNRGSWKNCKQEKDVKKVYNHQDYCNM